MSEIGQRHNWERRRSQRSEKLESEGLSMLDIEITKNVAHGSGAEVSQVIKYSRHEEKGVTR